MSEQITVDVALDNAARLLRNAEVQRDLALMDRLEKLADSWQRLAALLAQRERDAS